MDGCANHYRCATSLFLLSILLQSYNTIIDFGNSAPGQGKIGCRWPECYIKFYIYHIMATVQLPGGKRFDTQMEVHTETQNTDVSLSQESPKHLSNELQK